MAIRVLPAHVAARIAAGEVVERPASVVKELVENALDAGARRVEARLTGDRLTEISVADDGPGMPPDDLALALLRHATSKIDGSGPIAPATLGFRGEALPSIAAVAGVRISSRQPGSDAAFCVSAREGAAAGAPRPCAGGYGTRVDVTDLFASHPARLKFLKSRRAEAARVREVLDTAALSRPDVCFRFRIGDREGSYPEASSRAERAAAVLGPGFSAAAEGTFRSGQAHASAVACPPAPRGHSGALYLFVNGRPVSDRAIAAAVRAAYERYVGPGYAPSAAVFVEVPPEDVDVNVHPRKAEIRLRDPSAVAEAVMQAVSSSLSGAGLQPPSGIGEIARHLSGSVPGPEGERLRLPLGRYLGQAGRAWLVSETADGIAVVDQHAAHERVLMEKMRPAPGAAPAAQSRLPSPLRLRTSREAAAAVHDALPELSQAGFEIGADDCAITLAAVPRDLAGSDPEGLARAIVDAAESGLPAAAAGAAMWERLATAACRAAIKAGDAVDPERADALLREIEATPGASRCNHGRPTVLHLTHEDLRRLFGR